MVNRYQGQAQGFHGPIISTVEVEDGQITAIESEHSSHALVGNLGIQRVLDEVRGGTDIHDIDVITGASYSSRAFIDATRKAIAVSNGELDEDKAMDKEVTLWPESDATTSASEAMKPDVNSSVARQTITYSDELTFDEEYDVVIAGAGAAGLAAAVEASRGGKSVLIIEKAGIPGGTTNYSGGVIQAAGTKYQKELTPFSDDSAEKHAKLWIQAGENYVDPELVKDLAFNAADNLDWLVDMGLEIETVYGHNHIPYVADEYHADRIHQYKGGGAGGEGTIMIVAMLEEAQKSGAKIIYDTAVVALVQNKETGEVVGAQLSTKDGDLLVKANNGVVLATASIDHNTALARDLSPQHYNDLKYKTVLSTATDTGDGIMMGMGIGAATAGFGGCIDFDGKTGNATNNSIPTMPMIIVNGLGHRFVCEDAQYAYQYKAIFHQEKQLQKLTYMIFGENVIDAPGSVWTKESLTSDVGSGAVVKATTLEELAEKLDIPAENLNSQVATWNKNAKQGVDLEYGRKDGIAPIEGPSYYALKNHSTNLGSLGGLKINVDCQVLDHFGTVIPGLYAAGLNAGGWIGTYYPGSGTAIAGIVHQGRKAGKHLAR